MYGSQICSASDLKRVSYGTIHYTEISKERLFGGVHSAQIWDRFIPASPFQTAELYIGIANLVFSQAHLQDNYEILVTFESLMYFMPKK